MIGLWYPKCPWSVLDSKVLKYPDILGRPNSIPNLLDFVSNYTNIEINNNENRAKIGSDAPVEIGDPRIEFKAAISRKDLDGFHDVGWHLEQAVTREEALKMFTIWASYAVFEEDIKGSVEVGKLADFTIFSKDLMTVPEEEIMSSEVLMTIVDGRVVYSR